MMPFLPLLACIFQLTSTAFGATAEQWRGRSIYQILTDRFALPAGADPTTCDTGAQTWCGGTWNTIRENLDYIQDAGFTAIWISPVNQNYQGPRTAYGDPYHGYWMADITKLNDRFGKAEDLKALIDELHRRDMYIMVDIVVNNVMATSTEPDYSSYLFNDAAFYHNYCPVKYGNPDSERNCWMGDTRVTLPDVDTSNPSVIRAYGEWAKAFVEQWGVDGFRIDAAKHVEPDFWPKFCGPAGVFCIGEVYGDDVDLAASFQGPKALDSVLNYPMYGALQKAFMIPGSQNASALEEVLGEERRKFKDLTVLGNFLENQDLPRWHNSSVDPQSLYNAMAWTFMTDGIPIVYYGQEQGFSGIADPHNREPLWPSKYEKGASYRLIQQLNQLRNFLVRTTPEWLVDPVKVLSVNEFAIVIQKGYVVSVLTTIGSPPNGKATINAKTSFKPSTAMTDIITCHQWVIGASGLIQVEYSKGGVPIILVPSPDLAGSGMCGESLNVQRGGRVKGGLVSESESGVRGMREKRGGRGRWMGWGLGAFVGWALM
ncbi:alpha-amylase [Pterulicium gracile]|uniref:alpha-amylase n=1 Tax=Pterulicium gracile TaxID=1884261 RepID=A0A5C3QFH5_9AGAR|nr:alpha-amylase [Pterula gracilis]